MFSFAVSDTHANFDFLPCFCEANNTTRDDLLIILGDAGINYYGVDNKHEFHLKKMIAQQPITLFCIKGNHEDDPADLPQYDLTNDGIGDDFWIDTEYPNIWFAKDGGEYIINNQTYLAIGGAYSVDKYYRQMMGYKWFANEQLSIEKRMEILDTCYRNHYNHILTHTCPIQWEPTDLFLNCIDQNTVDKTTGQFLADVAKYCTFDNWWFGHFHADRMDVIGDGKVHMLFNQTEEII